MAPSRVALITVLLGLLVLISLGMAALAGFGTAFASGESVRKTDFGLMWWNKGLKSATTVERAMRLNIQTGTYGLQLNPSLAQVVKLGALPRACSRAEAMASGNEAVDALPDLSGQLWTEIGGERYGYKSSVMRGPMGATETQYLDTAWRVLEQGQLVQRFDITSVRFDKLGPKLRGRLEVQALPDFLNLVFEVTPMESLKGKAKLGFSLKLPDSWTNVQWLGGDPSSGSITVCDQAGYGASFIASPEGDGASAPRVELANGTLTFSLDNLDLKSAGDRGLAQWYEARYGFAVTVIPRQKASTSDITQHAVAGQVQVRAESLSGAPQPSVAYDPAFGAQEITMGPFTPNISPSSTADDLNTMERYAIHLDNPTDTDLYVPVVFIKPRGTMAYVTGYVAMLRDLTTGEPSGVPVQLTKNWHTREGVPMMFDGPWARSTAIVRVPARQTTNYELTTAIQNWGGLPSASLAQLCLVGWGTNGLWAESALGSHGESICFEPDGTQMPDGSMIDDTRPFQVAGMSGSVGKPGDWASMNTYTWTTNLGGGNFLVATDKRGLPLYPNGVRTDFVRYGPNLTELHMTYSLGTGDSIRADVAALLARTDDFVRVTYELHYSVLKDIDVRRLALFQLGSDSYAASEAKRLAIGNASGLVDAFAASKAKGGYVAGKSGIEVTGADPWVCLYDEGASKPGETGAVGSRGLVVRQWDAQLFGTPMPSPRFSVHDTTGWPTGGAAPQWELAGPALSGTLKVGDHVDAVLECVVLPQYVADYYGASQYLRELLSVGENSWEPFMAFARDSALKVNATVGRVLSSAPATIEVAATQEAELSLEGGIGYVPLVFTGLTDASGYVLESRPGDAGTWSPVDQAVHGNDFWQVDYDKTAGTFTRIYNVPRTSGSERLPRTWYRLRKVG